MKSPKLLYVIGTFFALFILTNQLYSQCNSSSFGLSQYTVLASQQNVTITDELSGLTYNDASDEFISVSDGGSIARRVTQGFWSAFGISSYGGSHCNDSRFSDVEAITYIGSSGNTHQYAIADERDRALVFVDIADSQNSLSHSSTYLKFNGLACGGNTGIEGTAYNPATGIMYFATESFAQKIYSFPIPTSINGQTVNVTEVIDLQQVTGLSTVSTHGLDILPNGNIVAIVTKPGSGNDNGLYPRMLVEVNPCGDLIDQFDLEPTIPNTAEIEGIAIKGSDIYLIGELGVFYQLTRQSPPSIQVTSPSGSASLVGGSSTSVNWVSTNVFGNVEIQLFLNGNYVSTLVNSTTNDGSQLISLPNVSVNTRDYSLRVVSKDDSSIYGESSTFIITTSGSISVISPSSGSSLTVGSSMAVTWTSQNVTGNITLELYKDDAFVSTLATNITNDGVQSILVPNVADGNDYRIKASSTNNSSLNDFSDLFTINNPGITLLSPTSGASFTSGDILDVQWNSVGITGSVKIELFKGGQFVSALENVTNNDGNESVTLPTVTTTANDYSIKVTSLVNPAFNDTSGSFEIAVQQVFEITNPIGGETFGSTSYIDVQWISTYDGLLRMELYKANTLVTTLASTTSNDGTQTVQLPAVNSTSSDYSIKLIYKNDTSIFDFSNTFTISQAEVITVLSPTSNDIFYTDNPISINWNSNFGGNVKIELFENGTLMSVFSSSTPNDNSETFTIPASLTGGNSCIVKITSLTNPAVSGSSSPFQIIDSSANGADSDLAIQSPGTGVQSDNIYSVNGITIINQGVAAVSGTYTVAAYLSVDQNITFSDFRIGTFDSFSNTGAGQTENSSLSFDASTLGLQDGNYYLGYIIDESDDVSESNEQNNTANTSELVRVRSNSGGNQGDCAELSSGDISDSFESNLGSWTQSTSDNMDWSRTNKSTPSSVTGPSAASSGNYFLYTEASNGNRNKSAVLTSECIDLSNTTSPRLTFDYHMYGSTMGALQVNIINNAGQSAIGFYELGNQGNAWKLAAISLSDYIGQIVTIEIEATTGVSYRSDIAIDNISIGDTQGCSLVGTACDDGDACTIGETYDLDCNCQGGVYTDIDQDGLCVGEDVDDNDPCLPVAGDACIGCNTTLSGGLTEGFEGNFNNWTQSNSSDNQWLTKSGSTPSSKTGPSEASEGNTYLYVEASHGGYPFKKATLNSACLDLSTLSTPNLSFDYSMYGSSMGSLNVYVIDMADGAATQIFTQSGNQGADWKSHQSDLSSFANKTVKIKIEAITGFGYRSDIAIDNIKVSDDVLNLDATETRNFVEQSSINTEEPGIENELLMYPIPAIDNITVEFETAEEIEEVTFSLINSGGQVIKSETLQLSSGLVEENINVSGLTAGTYYATIYSNSSKISKKILIID